MTGCESTAEVLNSTARVLNSTSSVLSGGSASSSSSSAHNSYTQKPNAQQQAQINSALTYKASNAQLKQAITEAKPVIYQFLEAASCQMYSTQPYAPDIKGVGKITSSNVPGGAAYYNGHNFWRIHAPEHHPKDKCLNVERVDNWSLETKNAFNFRVLFISEESGETVVKKMTMRKEDGEWRVYHFD